MQLDLLEISFQEQLNLFRNEILNVRQIFSFMFLLKRIGRFPCQMFVYLLFQYFLKNHHWISNFLSVLQRQNFQIPIV